MSCDGICQCPQCVPVVHAINGFPLPEQGEANSMQIGGEHYLLPIQPITYITENNVPYMEGNIIKYVTRWKNKNGVEDLHKAAHYLQMLIDMEKE